MTGAPALRVAGLVKDYPGGIRAVDGLDFSIEPGEVFALLGPNGAGKSTTIRIVVTLSTPTAGVVEVLGRDVVREPDAVRALVGYVPQEVALDKHLTGRQHLELSARLYRVPGAQVAGQVAAALDLVGLADRADEAIRRYSGGMKKRLDIACGLVHRPRLLVLDEPTLGLDIQTRHRIWDFVAELRTHGAAVLLTTHDMDEADHLADRVAIVDHGRIQALGTATELKRGYGGEMVRAELGQVEWTEADRAALEALDGVDALEVRGRALLFVTPSARELAPRVATCLEERHGVVPRSLSFGPPSLGDVFLKITGHGIRDDS